MFELAVAPTNDELTVRETDFRRTPRVFDGMTGGYRSLSQSAPMRSSEGGGWRGAAMQLQRLRPLQIERAFFPEALVLLHLTGPNVIRLNEGERVVEKSVEAGEITVIPRGTSGCFRSWEASDVLVLSLDCATMTCAASTKLEGVANADLRLSVGNGDRTIQMLMYGLKSELEARHPSGNVYAESLCHSVALELVKGYSRDLKESEARSRPRDGGLPRHLLRRALDFIYEHATSDVSLTQIASSVQMSPFHFSRLFKQSVGEPPYRHLLRHRLRCGVEMLVTRGLTISQVAGEIGFVDQSHFALHFKRFYGVTPRVYLRGLR